MVESLEKDNGIFYTPSQLADYICRAISDKNATILDPAYGRGALLLAARERLISLGAQSPSDQLFGYDLLSLCKVHQQTHFTKKLNEDHLIERDFFEYDEKYDRKKFDIILMNPPFVRHHKIEKNQLQKIRALIQDEIHLVNTSDLWAYFVVYSLRFIQKNGNLIAILPWSFIQADYAKKVREYLLDKFETIKVVAIGKQLFERVQERIIVIYCENFGEKTNNISVGYSFETPKTEIKLNKISPESWIDSPWREILIEDIHANLQKSLKMTNFQKLGDVAAIKIGTVTGANGFFILNAKELKLHKIPLKMTRPIIKHASKLKSLWVALEDNIHYFLLAIPSDTSLPEGLKDYIQAGEASGLQLGYHTKNRETWYSINISLPPDGFMPYMSKEIPYITHNLSGLLSTNSIHQIFYSPDVTDDMKKWIQFSMLSSISQLSIELHGKTYGGGVLKIEPTSAKQILIFTGNGSPFPKNLDMKVNKLLRNGKKRDAIDFVDNWLEDNLDFPRKNMKMIKKSYNAIREMRLSTKTIQRI
jgi:hypothetical protein